MSNADEPPFKAPEGAAHLLTGVGWKTKAEIDEYFAAVDSAIASLERLKELGSPEIARRMAEGWAAINAPEPRKGRARKSPGDWPLDLWYAATFSKATAPQLAGDFSGHSQTAVAKAIVRIRAENRRVGIKAVVQARIAEMLAETSAISLPSPMMDQIAAAMAQNVLLHWLETAPTWAGKT